MDISAWVLSICGVCLISVLIDLFMPESNISAFVKNIFNFVIILVVILPLPNVFNYAKNVSFDFKKQDIVLQEDYLASVNNQKLIAAKECIEKQLEEDGFLNVDVSISADIFEDEMQICAVFVDLGNLVILENVQHINIENKVFDVVLNFVNVEKEKIVISGK